MRRVLSGEFTVVNQHLLQDLTRLGLWNRDLKNELVHRDGSVQVIVLHQRACATECVDRPIKSTVHITIMLQRQQSGTSLLPCTAWSACPCDGKSRSSCRCHMAAYD